MLLPKKSSFCLFSFAGFAHFSEFPAFFAARRSDLRRSGGDFSAIDVRRLWWPVVVLVLRTSQLGSSSPSLSARYHQDFADFVCVCVKFGGFLPLVKLCCKMSWFTVNCGGEREKNRAISYQTKLRSNSSISRMWNVKLKDKKIQNFFYMLSVVVVVVVPYIVAIGHLLSIFFL